MFRFTLYGGRSDCLRAAFWLALIGTGVVLLPDYAALTLFILVAMLLLAAALDTAHGRDGRRTR